MNTLEADFMDTIGLALGTGNNAVKSVKIQNTEYYVVADILKVLGLTNTTRIINNLKKTTVTANKQICLKALISDISNGRGIRL